MKHLLLTLAVSIVLTGTVHAQTFWQDFKGEQGMVIPNGPTMGTFQDNKGNMGTYQSLGRQGMWQDLKGNQGQWMDNGPGMRQFSDNQGGHGQMFQNGQNMGTFTYQTPSGMTQGQFFQFPQ